MTVHRAALLVLVVALAACGGAHDAGPRDATQEMVASAAQRVAGKWLLVRYDPETRLGAVVSAFVQSQIGQMTVTIDGDVLTAQGPGVNVTRRIKISAAYGDHFDAQIVEPSGVGYDTSDELQGDKLIVGALALPWRGKALFTRVAP